MRPPRDIHAYGVKVARGRFQCVDCGHAIEHDGGSALPPCPRYVEETHPRAAWIPAKRLESVGGRHR